MAIDLSAWNPLDHPRDRLGRFRDKWSLSPAAKRMFQNVMRRFRPAEFRSDNHMSAFFRPKAQARSRRWSNEQQASLDYYLSPTSSEGMPGWADVNSTLRVNRPDMPQVRHMDSMMAPLEDHMILSRVVGPDAFGLTPEQMPAVEEWTGKLISDKAYISTNYGSPMQMQGPHIEMRILAPKGTRAIMANDGSRTVILDREQPLRITHVTEDGRGGFYVMAVAMPMRGNPEGSRALGRKLAPQEIAPAEEATPEAMQRRGLLPDGAPDPNAPPPPTPEEEEAARAARFDRPSSAPGDIPEWQDPDRPRRGREREDGGTVQEAIDNPDVDLAELRRRQAARREGGGEQAVQDRLRELERREAGRQRERMERLQELEERERQDIEDRIARLEARRNRDEQLAEEGERELAEIDRIEKEEAAAEANAPSGTRDADAIRKAQEAQDARQARRVELQKIRERARQQRAEEERQPREAVPTTARSFEEERARRTEARRGEEREQVSLQAPEGAAPKPAKKAAKKAAPAKKAAKKAAPAKKAAKKAAPAKKAAKKAAPAAPRLPRTAQGRRDYLADLIDRELESDNPDLDRRRGVANAPTPRERLTALRDRLRAGERNYGDFRDLMDADARTRSESGSNVYSRIRERFETDFPDRREERPQLRSLSAKKAAKKATPAAPEPGAADRSSTMAPRLAAKPPAALTPDSNEPDFSRMNVAQLRELARERGLPANTRHRRAELLEMLRNPEATQAVVAAKKAAKTARQEVAQAAKAAKKAAKVAPPAPPLDEVGELLDGLTLQEMRQLNNYGIGATIRGRSEARYRQELGDRLREQIGRARERGSGVNLVLNPLRAQRTRMVADREREYNQARDRFDQINNRRQGSWILEAMTGPNLVRFAEERGVEVTPAERRGAAAVTGGRISGTARTNMSALRNRILDTRTDWSPDYSTYDQDGLLDELERRFPGMRDLFEGGGNTALANELNADDARMRRGESRDTRIAELQQVAAQREVERQQQAAAAAAQRARQAASRINPDGLARMNPTDLRDLAMEHGIPGADAMNREDLVAALRNAGALSPQSARQGQWTRDQLERLNTSQLRTVATRRGLNTANLNGRDELIGAIASQFRSSQAPPLRDLATQLRAAGSSAERRRIVASHLDGNYGGLEARVDSVNLSGNTLTISAIITRPDGTPSGTVSRRITLPNARGQGGSVYNAFLSINRRDQGSGFAEEWNNNLFDWYRRSGIDEVRVTANIDVGGYAWATKGFDFADQSTAQRMFSSLRSAIVAMRTYDLDAAAADVRSIEGAALARFFGDGFTADDVRRQLALADALLARAGTAQWGDLGYPSAFELSQLGRPKGAGKNDRWLGKGLMLGTSWSGRLYL